MRVAVAFDHRGVKLRERVLDELSALHHEVVDLGTDTDAERVDYPDKALDLGLALREGEAERGILVCGSGVGASVAACKVPGIRAATAHDTYTAHQAVEHDDVNVLCLGARVIGPALAAEIIAAFAVAAFSGEERHRRRLGKINAIEAEFSGGS
jgi:ribose 5-phosphate isomerase B